MWYWSWCSHHSMENRTCGTGAGVHIIVWRIGHVVLELVFTS